MTSPLSQFNFKPETMDYVDCVINPFESDRPGRIPDLNTTNTLCFRDNRQLPTLKQEYGVYANKNDVSSISGVAIYFTAGRNVWTDTFMSSADVPQFYQISVVGLDSKGLVIFTNDAGDPGLQPVLDLNVSDVEANDEINNNDQEEEKSSFQKPFLKNNVSKK
jgi:hypothetical protein